MQRRSKRFWWISIPMVAIIIYFIVDSMTQKSISSLPGDFEEVAFVRNEQNKGVIIRIYAVTVGDIAKANFDACADLFPTNDYGSSTTIYFFDKNTPYPTTLQLDPPHYDLSKFNAISIIKRHGSQK